MKSYYKVLSFLGTLSSFLAGCSLLKFLFFCRIRYGINLGLLAFLTLLLFFMDSFAWKIVRLPLPPYFLTLPFFTSAILVTLAGYVCVPMLDRMKVHEPIRRLGLVTHSRRQTIPTMGGLFFVPIGVAVAIAMTRFSSIEVAGAAAVTVLFAVIGLVDDSLSLGSDNNTGLSAKIQLLLEVLLTDSYLLLFLLILLTCSTGV